MSILTSKPVVLIFIVTSSTGSYWLSALVYLIINPLFGNSIKQLQPVDLWISAGYPRRVPNQSLALTIPLNGGLRAGKARFATANAPVLDTLDHRFSTSGP
jgi:hypothetical protein